MVVGNLTQVLLVRADVSRRPSASCGGTARFGCFAIPATTGKLRLSEFSRDLRELGVNAAGDVPHASQRPEPDDQTD